MKMIVRIRRWLADAALSNVGCICSGSVSESSIERTLIIHDNLVSMFVHVVREHLFLNG